MSTENLIKKYVEAVSIPLVNTDNEKYPIRAGRVTHLFSKEYVKEFISDLNELKEKGLSHKDIGKLFVNPTRIARASHHIIREASKSGLSLEEKKKLALELIELISSMKHGNAFNDNKKNILLTDEQIKLILKEIKLTKATPENARLVQKLCGVMWAYSETPYFVAHDIAFEEHGIYQQPIGNIIIRDFSNLRPVELWQECENFPFETMRIICIYNKNFMADFDFYGNIYSKGSDQTSNLLYYYAEADGKPLDTDDIQNIFNTSFKIIESITNKVNKMNQKGIAKKYADIFWYRKKPMRDALGKDWKPSNDVYKEIDKGEIKPESTVQKTAEDITKELGLF